MSAEKSRFQLGAMVFSAMLGNAFGVATLSTIYALGSLAPPLGEAFGWSRAEIMSVAFVMLPGLAPMIVASGWFVDRFGAKKLIAGSQLGLSLCFVALSFVETLFQFYFLYALMAVVAAGSFPVTFARVIAANFTARRGLALGCALAGTGVAGLTVPYITTWAVIQFGWQGAYLVLAALPLIALPTTLLFIPAGSTGAAVALTPAQAGNSRAEIWGSIRSRRYAINTFVFCVAGGVLAAAAMSTVPMLVASGFEPLAAARLAGIIGITVIIGRLVMGHALDRAWAPLVTMIALLFPAAALFLLSLGTTDTLLILILLAVLGLSLGAEVDACAYLTSRYFGVRHFGLLYSIQYVIITVGTAVASLGMGATFDRTGSYSMAMLGSAILITAVAPLLLLLGPYPSPVEEEPHIA
ncbi:MAG: MFS transporter [Sphingomonadales bacterium]|nr:MAG: MFS transporter [Sphingomonadales bacterium]